MLAIPGCHQAPFSRSRPHRDHELIATHAQSSTSYPRLLATPHCAELLYNTNRTNTNPNRFRPSIHTAQDVARRRSLHRTRSLSIQTPLPTTPYLTKTSQLIRHTVSNFNIAPDKVAVSRISESLSTLNQARELRLREAETALRRLARNQATLASQHAEITSSHSSAAHADQIARLDTQKFRIAKAASDAEVETERLQAQAADLAARLQELELQGVDGGAGSGSSVVEDEVLLRLKVYRSLGIDIERDEKDGEFSRAVIRNDRKGDVHVVNMDRKFSRFFYANYFWQTL
jgi:kinetochore protein Spc24